jgi:hypothetical protein
MFDDFCLFSFINVYLFLLFLLYLLNENCLGIIELSKELIQVHKVISNKCNIEKIMKVSGDILFYDFKKKCTSLLSFINFVKI